LANLGWALRRKKDYSGSQAALEKALAADSNSYSARLGMAEVLAVSGQTDKAIAQYEAAAKLKPDEFAPHYNLGVLYLKSANFGKSVEEFFKALRINPNDVETMSLLGLAKFKTGDAEGGIAALSQATEKNPKFLPAWQNLGAIYLA